MTRWARSGSTQKHKKAPLAATPWAQLSRQGQESPPQTQEKRKENFQHQKFQNDLQGSSDSPICPVEVNNESKIDVKKEDGIFLQHKVPLKLTESCDIKNYPDQPIDSKDENMAKSSQNDLNKPDKGEEESQAKSPQDKVSEKKKYKYIDKLRKKREEKGILLLPTRVERKLYKIKRQLRKKGTSPAQIKEIIRKERRKAELMFRKTFDPNKQCFNCRQPGHVYANCPEKSTTVKQRTGICFKCGSEEHTSYKCPSKIQGYPFAKCFVCKEQGHITKDCPKNEHGIYPKGGMCGRCGNVNHLKKDCPTLRKNREEAPPLTLHTISQTTSVDAEIIDESSAPIKKKNIKKAKIVKF